MKQRTTPKRIWTAGGAFVFLMLVMPMGLRAAGIKKSDEAAWRARQALLTRLSTEWFNIGRLLGELSAIDDILQEIKMMQTYPSAVTRLTDNDLVALDREIEQRQKERRSIVQRVNALKPPLLDAIEILRQLVIGDPVTEMFEALEAGSIERLTEMIRIRRQIDSAWQNVNSLLSFAAVRMAISLPADTIARAAKFEADFFAIIRANAGLTSQPTIEKIGPIKDSLVARATSLARRNEMYVIHIHCLRELLKNHKLEAAVRHAIDMRRHFGSHEPYRDEISELLAQAYFLQGKYRQVLEEIPPQPKKALLLRLRIQSAYLLGMYADVWRWTKGFRFDTIANGSDRNFLLWLSLESSLALNDTSDLARLAAQADTRASFFAHLLHALGRSFARKGDWPSCLAVLERASRIKPLTPEEEAVERRIRLSIAQAYFEAKDYEKSLRHFFTLLNEENEFEEALYGIVWCYISLGRYEDAEMTMRKLINQSPPSHRAAEAALIMVRRYLSKARYEWSRLTQLDAEERRLAALWEKSTNLSLAPADTSHHRATAKAQQQIGTMLESVRAARRADYREISELYSLAERICSFVHHAYQTGSYQEISFSRTREEILHGLDSLLFHIRSAEAHGELPKSSALTSPQRRKGHIKKGVALSRILMAETSLNRYRFEREYIDWCKERNALRRNRLRIQQREPGDSGYARTTVIEAALDREMDSLVQAQERLNRLWRGRLIAECSALANDPVVSKEDAAYFWYQLGELYYEENNERYSAAFARYEQQLADYEKQMTAYRNGEPIPPPEEPVRPRLDHSHSVSCFTKAIELSRSPELVPAALYSRAWCYNDAGDIDSAVEQMQRLATGYPQSSYAPQALMYIGEIAFDKAMLQRASEAYRMVMNYPESQWFDEALYKYAWTQYRLSNPEKAISSFLALVDLGTKTTGKSLLEKESMDYIAISFSESDATGHKGLTRASRFVERFGDPNRGMQILHRLANVYRDQGRFDIAERTYETLLRKFPNHSNAPIAEHELLALRERNYGIANVIADKRNFFAKYHRRGSWAQTQKDSAVLFRADSLAEAVLYDASIGQHQLALQSNDPNAYGAAAQLYSQYIKTYPTSPRANECHYNLAEIMFARGNYYRAAEEYMTVSKRYPESKYREIAAWNAIVACQQLLKKEEAQKQ